MKEQPLRGYILQIVDFKILVTKIFKKACKDQGIAVIVVATVVVLVLVVVVVAVVFVNSSK